MAVRKVTVKSGPKSSLPGSDVATVAACQFVAKQYTESVAMDTVKQEPDVHGNNQNDMFSQQNLVKSNFLVACHFIMRSICL